jgi:3-hydroxyacyl-CoA dehydrogenase/enoyl-CoA hydratase/3-hydroxybutyryl-CoA epimerase
MPLLEIIRWEKTSPEALATARAYGQAQGKTVIVVEDGPGFYTTRILAPLMNEAILLLEEGADIRELDRAMRKFGFPVGPCALMDEVGIDVAAHVSKDLGAAFADRGISAPASLGEFEAAGFLGRKSGKGFYIYPKERVREKPVNEEAYRFFGGGERHLEDPLLAAERMTLAMVNEAIHCLGEGVLHSPRDGDAGAILGLGFPPFLGGPFRYADSRGIEELVKRLDGFAKKFGPRFAPAPKLLERKKRKKTFYPD